MEIEIYCKKCGNKLNTSIKILCENNIQIYIYRLALA